MINPPVRGKGTDRPRSITRRAVRIGRSARNPKIAKVASGLLGLPTHPCVWVSHLFASPHRQSSSSDGENIPFREGFHYSCVRGQLPRDADCMTAIQSNQELHDRQYCDRESRMKTANRHVCTTYLLHAVREQDGLSRSETSLEAGRGTAGPPSPDFLEALRTPCLTCVAADEADIACPCTKVEPLRLLEGSGLSSGRTLMESPYRASNSIMLDESYQSMCDLNSLSTIRISTGPNKSLEGFDRLRMDQAFCFVTNPPIFYKQSFVDLENTDPKFFFKIVQIITEQAVGQHGRNSVANFTMHAFPSIPEFVAVAVRLSTAIRTGQVDFITCKETFKGACRAIFSTLNRSKYKGPDGRSLSGAASLFARNSWLLLIPRICNDLAVAIVIEILKRQKDGDVDPDLEKLKLECQEIMARGGAQFVYEWSFRAAILDGELAARAGENIRAGKRKATSAHVGFKSFANSIEKFSDVLASEFELVRTGQPLRGALRFPIPWLSPWSFMAPAG